MPHQNRRRSSNSKKKVKAAGVENQSDSSSSYGSDSGSPTKKYRIYNITKKIVSKNTDSTITSNPATTLEFSDEITLAFKTMFQRIDDFRLAISTVSLSLPT